MPTTTDRLIKTIRVFSNPPTHTPLLIIDTNINAIKSLIAQCAKEKALDVCGSDDLNSENNVTPLIAACQSQIKQFIEWILDAGANVNAIDADGFTPLLFDYFHHLGNHELLLSKGATIAVQIASPALPNHHSATLDAKDTLLTLAANNHDQTSTVNFAKRIAPSLCQTLEIPKKNNASLEAHLTMNLIALGIELKDIETVIGYVDKESTDTQNILTLEAAQKFKQIICKINDPRVKALLEAIQFEELIKCLSYFHENTLNEYTKAEGQRNFLNQYQSLLSYYCDHQILINCFKAFKEPKLTEIIEVIIFSLIKHFQDAIPGIISFDILDLLNQRILEQLTLSPHINSYINTIKDEMILKCQNHFDKKDFTDDPFEDTSINTIALSTHNINAAKILREKLIFLQDYHPIISTLKIPTNERSANITTVIKNNIYYLNRSHDSSTPIMYAVTNGLVDDIHALIAAGASIDQTYDSQTLLHIAVKHNQFHSVKLLLKTKKIDRDLKDKSGMTAIQIAALNDDLDTLKLFFSLNTQKPNAATAADTASQIMPLSNTKLVMQLIAGGMPTKNYDNLTKWILTTNLSNITIDCIKNIFTALKTLANKDHEFLPSTTFLEKFYVCDPVNSKLDSINPKTDEINLLKDSVILLLEKLDANDISHHVQKETAKNVNKKEPDSNTFLSFKDILNKIKYRLLNDGFFKSISSLALLLNKISSDDTDELKLTQLKSFAPKLDKLVIICSHLQLLDANSYQFYYDEIDRAVKNLNKQIEKQSKKKQYEDELQKKQKQEDIKQKKLQKTLKRQEEETLKKQQQEATRLKQQEETKRKHEEAQLKQLEAKRKQEEERLKQLEAKKKQEEEQIKQLEAKKKQEEETKRKQLAAKIKQEEELKQFEAKKMQEEAKRKQVEAEHLKTIQQKPAATSKWAKRTGTPLNLFTLPPSKVESSNDTKQEKIKLLDLEIEETLRLSRKELLSHVFKWLPKKSYAVGSAVTKAIIDSITNLFNMKKYTENEIYDYFSRKGYSKNIIEKARTKHITIGDYDFVGKCTDDDISNILRHQFICAKHQPKPNLMQLYSYRDPSIKIDFSRLLNVDDQWMNSNVHTRDFTKFAIFLDEDGNIIDPTGRGYQDTLLGNLAMTGTLETFYADPIRMLRAIKFIAKGDLPDMLLHTALLEWNSIHLLHQTKQDQDHFIAKFNELIKQKGFYELLVQYGLMSKILWLVQPTQPGPLPVVTSLPNSFTIKPDALFIHGASAATIATNQINPSQFFYYPITHSYPGQPQPQWFTSYTSNGSN